LNKTWSVAALLLLAAASAGAQSEDSLICSNIFTLAVDRNMTASPIGRLMIDVGSRFIGRPYEAHTLDRGTEELLILNLRSFDCVTLIENTLALARCIRMNRYSLPAFTEELQKIRYRGGRIEGYASRLHYFTDWIRDNARKGVIRDITGELGGVPRKPGVNFMTSHRQLYPLLAPDSVYQQILEVERSLDTIPFCVLPKTDSVISRRGGESGIRSGDIIAITTTTPGLDISHTGIAYRDGEGTLRYLHAPDVGEKVTITTETLAHYLRRHASQTGILVIRPLEPGSGH
jgi:hypothetical protein